MYNISKIKLSDFKLFEDLEIEFHENNLIVFDGPNGFGKTSVFDAIELALTGTINRLHEVENRSNPSDVVVALKNSNKVKVELYLSTPQSQLVITRKLKNPLPESKRTKDFADLWELFVKQDSSSEEVLENQYQLDELIHTDQILHHYKLLHYVQQEDTAFFLKRNKEHERVKALEQLLGDTEAAELRLDRIKKISELIKDQLTKYTNRLTELGEQNPEVKDGTVGENVEYRRIFTWSEENFDREIIKEINNDAYEHNLLSLNRIRMLVENKEVFLSEWKYREACNRRPQYNDFIRYYIFLTQLSELQEKGKKHTLAQHALKFLTLETMDKIESECRLDTLAEMVSFNQKDDFLLLVNEILRDRKIMTSNGNMLNDLLRYREELKNVFEKVKPDDTECPLCGSRYDSHESLMASITQQSEVIKGLMDETNESIKLKTDRLKSSYILPLREALVEYLKLSDYPGNEHLEQLNEASRKSETFEAIKTWFTEQGILFEDLFLQTFNITEDDVNRRIETLLERISSKIPSLNDEYAEIRDRENFDTIFSRYFNSKTINLKAITIKDIDEKKKYLQYCFFSGVMKAVKEKDILTKKIENLEGKQKQLNSIKRIINNSKKSFLKTRVANIEIPFYIYSGKILQTHQAGIGSGIFFKDCSSSNTDKLQNIRLVSDYNSDHDVLNTMSSGQISSVVISLTLALHKVYAKGFNTLLIDDPVQTMDDINMISFVELLRNEFADKQIILSTHEEDTSKYLLYKYLKYGQRVMKYNLMERKPYYLSN